MKNQVFTPQLLSQVQWKDLLELTTFEKTNEVIISLPWLLASGVFAYYEMYVPALLCSFIFFLTGLRQTHNAFHYSIGISKKGTELLMFVLSFLMFSSMHAVKYNHLQHHKHCLGENDFEGSSARMKWWQALLFGPAFIFLHHYYALKNGNSKTRNWVMIEIAGMIVFTSIILYTQNEILLYHFMVMIFGEFMTAFFAVWTVHHDCDKDAVYSRTIRGKYMPKLFYHMFYHTEHHLFPKVPTCHLDKLAERIDAVIPEVKTKQVI